MTVSNPQLFLLYVMCATYIKNKADLDHTVTAAILIFSPQLQTSSRHKRVRSSICYFLIQHPCNHYTEYSFKSRNHETPRICLLNHATTLWTLMLSDGAISDLWMKAFACLHMQNGGQKKVPVYQNEYIKDTSEPAFALSKALKSRNKNI